LSLYFLTLIEQPTATVVLTSNLSIPGNSFLLPHYQSVNQLSQFMLTVRLSTKRKEFPGINWHVVPINKKAG